MADYDLGTARGRIVIDAASLARTSGALISLGRNLTIMGGLALGGFAVATTAAATFEKRISGFKAVTGTTGAQLDEVRKKALQLGRDTIFSANDVAEGFETLGKAGITAEEILHGAGDAVTLLAAAAEMDIPRAAEVAANALRTFALRAEDLPHVADLFAAAANRSTLEVEDLAVSMRYVGGVAHALGIPIEEVITVLGELGNAGIRGSTGGTALRRILLNLNPVSEKAAKTMKMLGIITADGANQFFDASGKAKSLAEIQQILQSSTANLSDSERIKALNTIFGNRAVASAAILAHGGAQAYNDFNTSLQGMTAADVAATKLDNLSGDIEILRGNLETLLVEAGSPFQEQLRKWVQSLTDLVAAFTRLSPETQQLIMKILLYGGSATVAAGATALILGQFVKLYKVVRDLWRGLVLLNGALRVMLGMNIGGMFMAAARGAASFSAALLANPIGLIIVAIVAFAAAWLLVYKNFKPFRNAVDAYVDFLLGTLWPALRGVAKFLIDKFGAAFSLVADVLGRVIAVARRFGSAIIGFIRDPIGTIQGLFARFGPTILRFIGGAIQGIIGFFGRLVAMVPGLAGRFVSGVMSFISQLPRRIGFVIGFILGLWVRFYMLLYSNAIRFGYRLIAAIVGFFMQLPGKIWSFLAMVIPLLIGWGATIIAWAITTGAEFVNGLIRFIQELPGRIWGFLVAAVGFLITFSGQALQWAIRTGQGILDGVIDFVRNLPGRIWEFIQNAIQFIRDAVPGAVRAAEDIGKGAYNAVVDFVTDLPGEVGRILGKVIDAFKDVIGRAFDAAKDFAGGLWDGFKAGLGIGSPSAIERAMFALNANMKKETKELRKHVLRVQRMSQGVPGVSLGNAERSLTMSTGAGTLSSPRSGVGSASSTVNQGDDVDINVHTDADPDAIVRAYMFHKRVRAAVG